MSRGPRDAVPGASGRSSVTASSPLQASDLVLIRRAQRIIHRRFSPGKHHVGSALQTKSGRIFAAVHVEANVGRVALCAEAVVLGMALATGETSIRRIVAVDRLGRVLTPCGMCRELILDYCPDAGVILADVAEPVMVRATELLPFRYVRA